MTTGGPSTGPPPAALETIAVDLTPVLPGGENGGAKVFAIELVRELARANPGTQFVLLTQSATHDELGKLDARNVRRLLRVGGGTAAVRGPLFAAAARLVAPWPAALRRRIGRFGYRVNAWIKRGGSLRLPAAMACDLLFCPFTAPAFHRKGLPTVCTVYDLQYAAYPQFFTVEDAEQRDRAFREAVEKAAFLVAISEHTRRAAIAHGGVDAARVRAIPIRLPQARRAASPDSGVLQRLRLAPGRYLLYPANFWKHKNHEMLLAAFGMACREGLPADVKLVCCGSPGSRGDWIADAARALGLGPRVALPGYVDREELAALLESAAGLVFPSLHEGFGLPVAEAMAAGVPVACSRTTALPEVAGDAAIYFDPGVPRQIADALVALIVDDALRQRLVARGLEQASRFEDVEAMAREHWRVFEAAAGTRAA